jgi:hypothetical protein
MSDGTAIVHAAPASIERPSQARLLTPRFNPIEMMEAHGVMRQWVFEALKSGKDYGIIPNTEKNTLLKPGTDKILKGFQLTAEVRILEREVDHDRLNTYDAGKWVCITDPGRAEKDRLKAQFPGRYRNKKGYNGNWEFQEKVEETGTSLGLYRYVVECRLYDPDGVYIGNSTGICSSMESKYIRSPRDAEHTIYSMAAKRARTAAVIAALGLTEIFEAEDEAPVAGKPQGYEEAPAPADAPEQSAQPVQIRGMAVIVRDWSILAAHKAEIEDTVLSRGLKLAEAIAEAQRTNGAPAVASPEAFLAWLDEAHPASNIVDVEVKE